MDELDIFPSDLGNKLREAGVHSLIEIPELLKELEETGNSWGFEIPKNDISRIKAILLKIPNLQGVRATETKAILPLLRITHCPHCGKQLWKKRNVSYWDHVRSSCKTKTGLTHLQKLPSDQIVLFCKVLGIPLNNPEVMKSIARKTKDQHISIATIHAILEYPDLRSIFRQEMIELLQLAPKIIKLISIKDRQEAANLFFESVILLNHPEQLRDMWNLVLKSPSLNGGMTVEKLSIWRQRLDGVEKQQEATPIHIQYETGPFHKVELKIDDRIAKSLTAATNLFLSRCRTRSTYVTMGMFNLNIPYTIVNPVGLPSLEMTINVDNKGMEVYTHLLETNFAFQWIPHEDWPVGKGVTGMYFHAILSAIWHDLRVSGVDLLKHWNTETPKTSASYQRHSPIKSTKLIYIHQERPRRQRSFIYVPRSYAETAQKTNMPRRKQNDRLQNIITTWVAGHLMLLPNGSKASSEALLRAENDGVLVPFGMTYVRPYLRGQGQQLPVSRKVVATGLNTIYAVISNRGQ